jgi:hypothetical protein
LALEPQIADVLLLCPTSVMHGSCMYNARPRRRPGSSDCEKQVGMAGEHIGEWVAAFLIAKVLRDSLRLFERQEGMFPRALIASYAAGIPLFAVIVHQNLFGACLIAIIHRLAMFYRQHILGVINHHFLEFLLLLVVLVLHREPAQMASLIQVLLVSVWSFSIWQKLYRGEFADGSFYYCLFANRAPGLKLVLRPFAVGNVAPLGGSYHEVSQPALERCKRLAWVTIAIEIVVPFFALRISGTLLAVACMIALSVPVGLVSNEHDFLVTNMILAALFFAPFRLDHILEAAQNHVAVRGILLWAALWPVVHAVVGRRLRISSWLLFGWGMYATTPPAVYEIGTGGILRPYKGTRRNALRAIGDCKLAVARRMSMTFALDRCHSPAPATVGVDIQKRYRVSNKMVSRHIVLAPGREPAIFEVTDELTNAAFEQYLSDLTEPASSD